MLTLTDYTQPLRPYIPPSVISDRAFDYMLTLTSHFPAALANRITDFEIYFQEDRSDFALQFPATDEGRQQLLQASMFDHPDWRKVVRFSSLWSDPASPLYQDIYHTWLSFDVNQPISDVPVPCVFYCGISADRKADPAPTILLMADIFNNPSDIALLTANLNHCLQHIPPQARINEVGFGLLRNRDCIRIQVLGIYPQEIPAYLEAVGWQYSTTPLQPLLDQLSILDRVALLIDVAASAHPRVHARIGFESYLNRHDARWQTLLDYLVKQELCQPAQRDFVVHFPGIKACLMDQQLSLTQQRLSHIKIAYHPDQTLAPFEAKAYLTNLPDWLSITTDEAGG